MSTQRFEGPLFRMPDYDPVTGEHAWVLTMTYLVEDPAAHGQQGTPLALDGSNLVAITPAYCFHCEKPYTELLAEAPCDGDPA